MEDLIKMAKDTERMRELLFKAQEDDNREWAMYGLDQLAGIVALAKEMEYPLQALMNNTLLDKDSERIVSKLYNALGNFFQTDSLHVEDNLSNYIEEDD